MCSTEDEKNLQYSFKSLQKIGISSKSTDINLFFNHFSGFLHREVEFQYLNIEPLSLHPIAYLKPN